MSKGKGQTQKLRDFIRTNRQFVILRSEEKIELKRATQQELLTLLKTMPLDERLQFYFDNFESIFVSIFPEDIGNFAFVPDSSESWDELEENLTRTS